MSENKPVIDKEQIFTYSMLFTICKSAVKQATGCETSKTDRIIMNSVSKAVEKHVNSKKEEM